MFIGSTVASTPTSASLSLLVPFVVLFFSHGVFGVDFPAPIQKCHMNDEKCMIEQAQKVLSTYQHGNAELGLPDLEPFRLEKLDVLNDVNSPSHINLHLSDLKFHNYSQLMFKKFRGFSKDLTKPMKIVSQSVIPVLSLRAKYKINGKVLVLPIMGEGDLECILTEVDVKTVMKVMPEKRDGKTFLKINDYRVMSKSKNIHIDMTNLFNGDAALSENMLKLLNENWTLMGDEIQPKIDEALAAENLKTLKKLVASVPYEDFFLPKTNSDQ